MPAASSPAVAEQAPPQGPEAPPGPRRLFSRREQPGRHRHGRGSTDAGTQQDPGDDSVHTGKGQGAVPMPQPAEGWPSPSAVCRRGRPPPRRPPGAWQVVAEQSRVRARSPPRFTDEDQVTPLLPRWPPCAVSLCPCCHPGFARRAVRDASFSGQCGSAHPRHTRPCRSPAAFAVSVRSLRTHDTRVHRPRARGLVSRRPRQGGPASTDGSQCLLVTGDTVRQAPHETGTEGRTPR